MTGHFIITGFLPGVGPGEYLLVFLVVLLIFGPKRLPEIGKALGEFVNQFKKASNAFSNTEEVKEEKH